MKAEDEESLTQAELIRLALKLREDLLNLAETRSDCQDFSVVLDSAGALIVAITDPRGPTLSPLPVKKTAQMYSFARRRRMNSTPLH